MMRQMQGATILEPCGLPRHSHEGRRLGGGSIAEFADIAADVPPKAMGKQVDTGEFGNQ